MTRSLPLAAYLALRRPNGPGDPAPAPERPACPLVWVHCPQPARLGAVTALAQRVAAEDGEGVRFLLTMPPEKGIAPAPLRQAGPGAETVILQPAPPDLRAAARAFLAHWRPDLMVWMHGDLRPALLDETVRAGVPRLMIDASAAGLAPMAGGWIPGLTRSLLNLFETILAVDEEAAQRLRRIGVDEGRITVAGALDSGALALPCNDRDRRDLAQTIGTRPVWLAVEAPLAELAAVAEAHRQASRRAHRLLLVLVPADPADLPEAARIMRAAGFEVAQRADGAEPDEATQVYLADGPSEMGLWYRLAPLSFLGGTLAGDGGRDPFEAAALGSVVLHGLRAGRHGGSYLRLARAGASRSVRDATELGAAVEALLAPDKAAAMAHAAWDVTSSGAEVTNRVIDLIRDRLGLASPGDNIFHGIFGPERP